MAALLCEGVACFWSYAGIKKSSIAFPYIMKMGYFLFYGGDFEALKDA